MGFNAEIIARHAHSSRWITEPGAHEVEIVGWCYDSAGRRE